MKKFIAAMIIISSFIFVFLTSETNSTISVTPIVNASETNLKENSTPSFEPLNFKYNPDVLQSEVTDKEDIDYIINTIFKGNDLTCDPYYTVPSNYDHMITNDDGSVVLAYKVVNKDGSEGYFYMPPTTLGIGQEYVNPQEGIDYYEVCAGDGTKHFFDNENDARSFDKLNSGELTTQQITENKKTVDAFNEQYRLNL